MMARRGYNPVPRPMRLTSRERRRKRNRAREVERGLLDNAARYGWNESTLNLYNRARRIARNG